MADTTQMYEKKITELIKQLEIEHARSEGAEEQVDTMKKLISDNQKSIEVFTLYVQYWNGFYVLFSISLLHALPFHPKTYILLSLFIF